MLGHKKGFTLAEVLITLLIIGVVASITIPSLIQDTQEAELRTAWKKEYAVFSQAIKQIYAENASVDFGDYYTDFGNRFINALSEKVNVVKKSPKYSSGWYFHQNGEWKSLNNHPCTVSIGYSTGILADGSLFYATPSEVLIDVNGFKSPNVLGKDIYAMKIYANGIVKPVGIRTMTMLGTCDSSYCYGTVQANEPCDSNHKGWGCSALYLYQ